MKIQIIAIIASICFLALTSCNDTLTDQELGITPETPPTEKVQRIDSWLTTLHEEGKFNGTVLYVNEGEQMLSKGYGYSDFRKDVELTENSSLRLGSVSKQFTAAGIMLLEEKGKINYDDFVSKYIRNFPYEQVTIRNLLNQVSGIPDIYIQLALKKKDEITLLTNKLAVDLIINENRKREALPNSEYSYSNTNYIILARLIEVISGLSFEEYMKQELFMPLGMNNTRVWNLISAEQTFENKADDFDNNGSNSIEVKPTFLDGVAGDGAVFSSAKDMFLWDKFWYENPLIGEANLQEAFKKPVLNDGKTSDYGFGWVITEDGMWHNGSWLGARTIIIRNTQKKDCIVLLDNSSNKHFPEIIEELRTIVQ